MSDGTRAALSRDEAPDWLDQLCLPELRLRIASSVETGRALLRLLASWTDTARGVVGDFEAGLRGRGVPDDMFAALERLVGIRELIDLVEELADLGDRFADLPDGD